MNEPTPPAQPSEAELRSWIAKLDEVLDSGIALPDGKRQDMELKRKEYRRKLRHFYGTDDHGTDDGS
jgi:hypothetical protein